jgi:hypothetical protein
MLDLSVDAHDVVVSEGHPISSPPTSKNVVDTDQHDPKGGWPNLSQRSNEQQDNNKRIKFETDQIKPS